MFLNLVVTIIGGERARKFVIVFSFPLSFPSYSWFMTDVDSGRRFYCPPKMIPIISEFNTHFTIPLGGPKGAEVVFDYITTDFSVQGRYNGGRKKLDEKLVTF